MEGSGSSGGERTGETRAPSVEEILSLRHNWYHTIDLAPGVTTPGWIDLRHKVDVPAIPTDLRGQRVLDVGTFDGFWAFEMERRGAQVVAIDTDDVPPPDTPEIHRGRMAEEAAGAETGTGFAALHRYFGSAVERRTLSVYRLTAEGVGGAVELAFVGSLLLHLRDPVGALERLHEAIVPGGRVICFEPVDRRLSLRRRPVARYLALETPWTWWYPNRACLEQWLRTAGFVDVAVRATTWVVDRHGHRQQLAAVHGRRSAG